MISLSPGMVDPVFSIGSASAGETVQETAGTTFAVTPTPYGNAQENEVVVEYTEQTAPATVVMNDDGIALDLSLPNEIKET